MHHLLANRSTGGEAVECSEKHEISGQPNAVAQSFFDSKNDCKNPHSKIAFLENRMEGMPLHYGIPVGISERVSVQYPVLCKE